VFQITIHLVPTVHLPLVTMKKWTFLEFLFVLISSLGAISLYGSHRNLFITRDPHMNASRSFGHQESLPNPPRLSSPSSQTSTTNYTASTLLSQSLKQPWTIHKLTESELVKSPHTIVTAYFRLKSKYAASEYDTWMKHFLSIQDPIVVFTSPDLVSTIRDLRLQGGPHSSTVIVECQLSDLPIGFMNKGKKYSHNIKRGMSYWEYQLEIDAEKRRHRSFELFWIWLSKVWFVNQAIDADYFESDFYMWSDIGSFRKPYYDGKRVIPNQESIDRVVPDRNTVLWLAHRNINPPDTYVWINKLRDKDHFYHSGSQAAGYKDAFKQFLPEMAKTLDDFDTVFVGEDQCILQATCLRNPKLCAYIPSGQVKDNRYFGLRYVFYHNHSKAGSEFKIWRAPEPDPSF